MIEKLAEVKVTKLLPLNDETLPECFVKTRRLHMQGTVDSPIYLSFNKLWLVKHITSGLRRGISVGRYGIYHEDELEILSLPKKPYEEDDEFSDTEFDYRDLELPELDDLD